VVIFIIHRRQVFTMKKIIFTTIGSLGDLHPVMGIAKKLQEMGHHPIIAASEFYRTYIEAADINFHPIRPYINHEDPKIIKAVLDTQKGPEILHKQFIFPELQKYRRSFANNRRSRFNCIKCPHIFCSNRLPYFRSSLGK